MPNRRSPALPILSVLALLPTLLLAQEPECLPRILPLQEKCVYSESVEIGVAVFRSRGTTANFTVTFNSNSFRGVERVRTAQGFEFRQAGRPITEYPDTITVVVKPDWASENKFFTNPEVISYHVEIRWLDSAHRVIDSKSGELREVVELQKSVTSYPWPELGPPRVWYVANFSGIKQPLATEVEVVITGGGGTPTVRGKLFYPYIPATSAAASK